MANAFSQIYLQFVFAVQGRQNVISPSHKDELHAYITGLVSNQKTKMLAIHCMPDHCHILVAFKPVITIADFVNEIKSESNEFINNKKWIKGRFCCRRDMGSFPIRVPIFRRLFVIYAIRKIITGKNHSSRSTKNFWRSFKVPLMKSIFFKPSDVWHFYSTKKRPGFPQSFSLIIAVISY